MRTAGLIGLLLLALGSAFALWFDRLSQEQTAAPRQFSPEETDYVMHQFTAVIYDAAGQPSQELSGKRMQHYPFDNRFEVIEPVGVTTQGEQHWKITAARAIASNNLDELKWLGGVNLSQTQPDSALIKTPELLQHPRQYVARSDKGVKLSTEQSQIQAEGLHLNTRTSKLTLKGHVQSSYQTR